MPKASEHNDKHNEETQTQRGAGFWQKESHKSHVQTQTHTFSSHKNTLAHASIVHICTCADINAHSQCAQRHNTGIIMADREGQTGVRAQWVFEEIHMHLHFIQRQPSPHPKGLHPKGNERLLKQLGDHKVREIHKRQSDKNYVDGKERDRKMSNRATWFMWFSTSVDRVTL